jgi:hypothetical protein
MILDSAQLTLRKPWIAKNARSKSGRSALINYGGLTPRNFFLVTFATQPVPVLSGYSTVLINTALFTTTGAFLLPNWEIVRS